MNKSAFRGILPGIPRILDFSSEFPKNVPQRSSPRSSSRTRIIGGSRIVGYLFSIAS